MLAEIRLSELTARELRKVIVALHRHRDAIPTYNHGGTIAEHWAPVVHVEGPEYFGLVTPKLPAAVAGRVLSALTEGTPSCT